MRLSLRFSPALTLLCWGSLVSVLSLEAFAAQPTAADNAPAIGSIQTAQSTSQDSAQPLVTPSTAASIAVVRSADNRAQWETIVERLSATGLDYQVIEWDEVRRSTQFEGIQVLFLPNVETISSGQLISLQTWLNSGGRLIVSGATGSQSSAGVQNALRSLLGAYWGTELAQPQALQPLQIASQRWVRSAASGTGILGGVVVPTSLASEPVAVWQSPDQGVQPGSASNQQRAAVVVTQKSTFLGWEWGSASSNSQFDSSWLQAAVGRFQEGRPRSIAQTTAAAPAPNRETDRSSRAQNQTGNRTQNQTQHQTQNRAPNRTRNQAQNLAQNSAQNLAQNSAQTQEQSTRPDRFTRATTRAQVEQLLNRSNPTPTAPATASALSSSAPLPPASLPAPSRPSSQDPAEQVAAAEIDVERLTRITLYQATTMRQELENLIGRYESARLLSQVRTASRSTQPQAASSAPVAVSYSVPKTEAEASHSTTETAARSSLIDDAVLTQARQGYAAFNQALQNRDYGTARQQWLDTRQLLWENFPLDQPLSQSEVRAIWLDRGTIVRAGSRQGLATLFDRLQTAGINTIFFETVNAGYPIYPSRVAPQQNPLTRHWDPLAEAVELAHARQMELHAWVWTFAAGNQMHNALLNQPASYPGPILDAHPGWANYDNRGSMIPPGQTKPFLDPANPEVRQYLLSLFEEIVTRYDVDGLQLDYIRYPFQDPWAGGHTYGYGRAARQQFQQLTGVDPVNLTPIDLTLNLSAAQSQSREVQLWQQWTEFRLAQINDFVAETSRLVHRLNPEAVLSAAVFALPERRRISEIQQNWELWAQQGTVDMIVLMSYASDTNGLQRLANPWLTDTDLQSTLIVPGIRMLNLTEQSIVDQVQALRDSPSGGFALFAAENLNGRLQDIFQQIQGASSPSDEAIPYRDPFVAAAERYRLLLQQWNWLIDQGQLQLSDQQLETWRNKTTALDQALQRLAADPSADHLQQAQTALSAFQSRLTSWINLPELSEGYRTQTWQNQLSTLERLLNYGERVVITRQNGIQQAAEP